MGDPLSNTSHLRKQLLLWKCFNLPRLQGHAKNQNPGRHAQESLENFEALSQKTLTPLLQQGFSKVRTEPERGFPVCPSSWNTSCKILFGRVKLSPKPQGSSAAACPVPSADDLLTGDWNTSQGSGQKAGSILREA